MTSTDAAARHYRIHGAWPEWFGRLSATEQHAARRLLEGPLRRALRRLVRWLGVRP